MADRDTVEQGIEGVDVVYHLALNWNGDCWGQTLPIADRMDTNIRGTLNLLEAATSHRVKHFLYAGSVAVYGKRDSPVMSEEEVCRPELWREGPGPSYAITKLAIERLCLLYSIERGLPCTAFRIDVVFDDDEYQDLSHETIQTALEGKPLQVVRGQVGASIHVDDVASAFLKATLNESVYGEVMNLSNPDAQISDLDVVRLVIDSVGSKSPVELVKAGLTGPLIASVKKAETLLDWKPLKGKEDLKRTIIRMAQKGSRPSRR